MNYQFDAGIKPKRKLNPVCDQPGKYWATLDLESKPFERSDGTIGVDKTKGFHSRPGKKESLRQANRSYKKAARRELKNSMNEEVSNISSNRTMEPYDIACNLLSDAVKLGLDAPTAAMIERALLEAKYEAFEEAKDMLEEGGYKDAARYLNREQELKELENLY